MAKGRKLKEGEIVVESEGGIISVLEGVTDGYGSFMTSVQVIADGLLNHTSHWCAECKYKPVFDRYKNVKGRFISDYVRK